MLFAQDAARENLPFFKVTMPRSLCGHVLGDAYGPLHEHVFIGIRYRYHHSSSTLLSRPGLSSL